MVAGRDIDRVARLHRENPAMPTFYHVFRCGAGRGGAGTLAGVGLPAPSGAMHASRPACAPVSEGPHQGGGGV